VLTLVNNTMFRMGDPAWVSHHMVKRPFANLFRIRGLIALLETLYDIVNISLNPFSGSQVNRTYIHHFLV
jgi:hypothetical protein